MAKSVLSAKHRHRTHSTTTLGVADFKAVGHIMEGALAERGEIIGARLP